MTSGDRNTDITRHRYNRVAPFWDLMETVVESSRYGRWRRLQWSKVEGTRILEVGVGTQSQLPSPAIILKCHQLFFFCAIPRYSGRCDLS